MSANAGNQYTRSPMSRAWSSMRATPSLTAAVSASAARLNVQRSTLASEDALRHPRSASRARERVVLTSSLSSMGTLRTIFVHLDDVDDEEDVVVSTRQPPPSELNASIARSTSSALTTPAARPLDALTRSTSESSAHIPPSCARDARQRSATLTASSAYHSDNPKICPHALLRDAKGSTPVVAHIAWNAARNSGSALIAARCDCAKISSALENLANCRAASSRSSS
mmetsp:Transcript_3673/g.12349  ORF Transcript_3673/g.12349 Transcript_3673/m.12349 type:complete len:227 (-) Transcript_3673:113-793(-)